MPVLILAAIAAFVFYKLPGIAGRPGATAAGRRGDVRGQGLPLLLAVRVPERRDRRRPHAGPGGQTVELDVTAPDFDVIHSWWIPRSAARSTRSRARQRDLVPGERAGHLRGPVRRALRPPARGDDRGRAGAAAGGVRRLARGGGASPRPAAASARRRSTASAPSATASTARASSARRSPGNACSPTTRARSRRSSGTARARCRRSARTGATSRWTRSSTTSRTRCCSGG